MGIEDEIRRRYEASKSRQHEAARSQAADDARLRELLPPAVVKINSMGQETARAYRAINQPELIAIVELGWRSKIKVVGHCWRIVDGIYIQPSGHFFFNRAGGKNGFHAVRQAAAAQNFRGQWAVRGTLPLDYTVKQDDLTLVSPLTWSENEKGVWSRHDSRDTSKVLGKHFAVLPDGRPAVLSMFSGNADDPPYIRAIDLEQAILNGPGHYYGL